MKNKVTHFEIPADNLERAQKFYGEVFDWKFDPWDENHTMVTSAEVDDLGTIIKPGCINGSIQRRGYRSQTPTIVISVEDIEVTLKKISELGGKVVVPKNVVGDMGAYAQFEDLEGNRIGLFEVDV